MSKDINQFTGLPGVSQISGQRKAVNLSMLLDQAIDALGWDDEETVTAAWENIRAVEGELENGGLDPLEANKLYLKLSRFYIDREDPATARKLQLKAMALLRRNL